LTRFDWRNVPHDGRGVVYDRGPKSRAWWCGLFAMTLCLALFGYATFAPFIQILTPDSSLLAILIRSIICVLCCICVVVMPKHNISKWVVLLPLVLFLSLYGLRFLENAFIRELVWQVDPNIAMSIFFGGALVPIFMLGLTDIKLDEQALQRTVWILTLLFVVGLFLNFNELRSVVENGQAHLFKLNQISLGNQSLSFVLLLLLVKTQNWVMMVAKFSLIAVLLIVAAFSQARGPQLAFSFALFVFLVVSSGSYRRRIIISAILIVAGVVAAAQWTDFNLYDIAVKRFNFSFDNLDSSSTGRVDAWHASIEQFWDSPIIGDKVFEPTLRTYPHNFVLESLISIGIIGTLPLIMFLWQSISSAIKLLLRNPSFVNNGITLLFLKELVQVMLSGGIWGDTSFWITGAAVILLGQKQIAIVKGKKIAMATAHLDHSVIHLRHKSAWNTEGRRA
jgi:O-antigen ligase